MKLVYVAGPYRGKNAWEIEENIHAARRVGARIASLGYMPVIPHANTAHFDGLQSDEFWLEGTLDLMRRCDMVVMVEGWEKSTGARGEYEEALRIGLPVYESWIELKGSASKRELAVDECTAGERMFEAMRNVWVSRKELVNIAGGNRKVSLEALARLMKGGLLQLVSGQYTLSEAGKVATPSAIAAALGSVGARS